jgi:hypothetical protein
MTAAATLMAGDLELEVTVHLDGHVEPLDGHFQWYGRIDRSETWSPRRTRERRQRTWSSPAVRPRRSGWPSTTREATSTSAEPVLRRTLSRRSRSTCRPKQRESR